MFVEIGRQHINLDNVTRIAYRDVDSAGRPYMEVRFVGGTSTKVHGPEIEEVERALGDTTFVRNRRNRRAIAPLFERQTA